MEFLKTATVRITPEILSLIAGNLRIQRRLAGYVSSEADAVAQEEAAKKSKMSEDGAKDSAPKLGGWEEFDVDGLLR